MALFGLVFWVERERTFAEFPILVRFLFTFRSYRVQGLLFGAVMLQTL